MKFMEKKQLAKASCYASKITIFREDVKFGEISWILDNHFVNKCLVNLRIKKKSIFKNQNQHGIVFYLSISIKIWDLNRTFLPNFVFFTVKSPGII